MAEAMRWLITLFIVFATITSTFSQTQLFSGAPTISTACSDGQGGGSNLREKNVFSPSPSICPSAYYVPGTGNPAVSTADYFLENGLYGLTAYDLDTMGAEGAAIKASSGYRYVWIIAPDHPDGTTFQGSSDFRVGYSNDPQVLPTTTTVLLRYNTVFSIGGQTGFVIYQYPQLVYNPDSAGDKFWIYAEAHATNRQHEMALFTTADFLTATVVAPPIPTTMFQGWTSLGRIYRLGTGSWIAYTNGTPSGGSGIDFYKYTSADGLSWSIGSQLTPTNSIVGGSSITRPTTCDPVTYQGQDYVVVREQTNGNVAPSVSYVTMVPIDSNGNMLSSPAAIRLTDSFSNLYPGPGFLQNIGCLQESGVLHMLITRGFGTSGSSYTLDDGVYTGIPSYSITATVSGTTLTVSSISGGTIVVGNLIVGVGNVTVFGSGTGGTGTYTISASHSFPTPTVYTVMATGGLWQQFADRYSFVLDSTSASNAAPSGLKASTAYGVVTLTWDSGLPVNNFRVYRGPTKTGPFSLVGDVVGTSATDTPQPGYWWYNVVTLNSGEQGSRTVSAYSEGAVNARVNTHIKRVIDDGGDYTTIDVPWLVKLDQWLVDNGLYKYLQVWADPSLGVKQAGGFVTKVYDYGTSRLPRGGDFTPCTSNTFPCTTSNTTYSATGLNGFAPAWVNGAGTTHGYFGSGLIDNIQRKTQITTFAVYQKPGTAVATPMASGLLSGMTLFHGAGTPGTITFQLSPSPIPPSNRVVATATPPGSATAAHLIGGVFDGTNLIAYADGVAGTPVDGSAFSNPGLTNSAVLKGMYGATTSTIPFLGSGSTESQFTTTSATYTFGNNEGLFSAGALILFEAGLNSSQMAALTLFWQQRIGLAQKTYNVVTDFGASCTNGNDEAAFLSAQTTMLAWQALHPTDLIELDLPSGGTCAFPGTTAQRWTDGIKQLQVVGLGSGATLTNKANSTPGFFLAGQGMYQDNSHHARTATVSAGSSCVTLTTPGDFSRFTVGGYALMTGFDLQGVYGSSFGFPPNLHYFDYVKVATAVSGQVCFATPLSHTYESTWPHYADGTASEADQGGPATLYALKPSWDTDVRYRNVTIDQTSTSFATAGSGRLVSLIGSTVNGTLGVWPSTNYQMAFINTTMASAVMEVDKLVTYAVFSGGTIKQIDVQSSSVDQLVLHATTVTTSLTGTPKRFFGWGATLAAWSVGATAYGRSDESICVNCAVTAFSESGILEKGPGDIGINVADSMAGGVISYPNGTAVTGTADNGSGKVRLAVTSTTGFVTNQTANIAGVGGTTEANGNQTIAVIDGTHIDLPTKNFVNPYTSGGVIGNAAPRWAVPGTNLFWSGSLVTEGALRIVDVTQTSTGGAGLGSTLIQTTLAGGFPALPLTGGKLFLKVHPAAKFTCTGCTGAADLVSIGSAPAAYPLYAYNSRSYTAAIGTTTQAVWSVWGNPTQINYNVTVAAASAQLGNLSAFNNWGVVNSSGSEVNYSGTGPRINMQSVGNRQVTLAGSSCASGTCTGDTAITLPDAVTSWFGGVSHSGFAFSTDLSGACPGVNCSAIAITIQTDQGVVNP